MSHPDTSFAAPLLVLTALLTAAAVPTPVTAQPPADLELVQVASGFNRAIALRHAGDGSGRLFVVEQGGLIWVWDGVSAPTVFLDLTAAVDDCGGEQGLLGLDFHPDYATNGFFYVNYTEPLSLPAPDCDEQPVDARDTAVERYSVSADPDLADPGSALRILTVAQDFPNHNGGNLLFAPDGFLYVGMGDGGSGGDPFERAQDLDSLLGKMLRLDVDGDDFPADPESNYVVPPDNPFVGVAGRDEIWATGLRNPWRFSFDRLTGDLFIGDVGQNSIEEIDFQPASSSGGEDYGWDCREGSEFFVPPISDPPTPCSGSEVDPILEYDHGLGCSVTGGYRYRGHRVVGLQGTYVYADYCTGRIWFGTEDAMVGWSSSEWDVTGLNVTSFGEDEDGELYVVDENLIFRFESPSSIFTDGFESGDTSAW